MTSPTRYASGKYARAMCDICGREVPYRDLRLQWDGLRVCEEDWSEKHPQLTPKIRSDAQALRHPRPDRDDDGDAITDLSDLFPNTSGGGSL